MPGNLKITAGTRSFLLVLMTLALLLPLTGWLLVTIQTPQVEREAYANLAAIADLKTAQIESWLTERQKTGQMLTTEQEFARHVARTQVKSSTQKRDLHVVQQRFEQLIAAYDYDRIALLDLHGQVLVSAGNAADLAPSTGSMLQQVLDDGQVLRSEPRVNSRGQVRLQWLLPVFDALTSPHQVIALVLMDVVPDRVLFPILQSWPTSSPSGEILLVKREGEMAVFMNPLRHRKGTAMTLRLPLSDADLLAATALNSPAAGRVMGADHRGVRVLAAFRPVANTSWRVVAKIDQAEVLAPVHLLAWWVSAVVALALAALGLVLALFWRQTRRAQRLEVLAEKAKSDQLMARFLSLPFIGMATGALDQPGWRRYNSHFCTIVGCSPHQMEALRWGDLVEPDDYEDDLRGFERLMRGEIDVYAVDRRIHPRGGPEVFVSMQLRAMGDPALDAAPCVILLQDITQRCLAERKLTRQSRLYAALSQCNQAIAHCVSQAQLAATVCQTAVTLGGMSRAWIGTVERDPARVLRLASAGDDACVLASIDLAPSAERVLDGGSVGLALREDRPVWLQNRLNSAPCRATAAIPLHLGGQVVGVFFLTSDELDAFDAAGQALLTEMASDVDFALDNLAREAQRQRAETLLQQSQARLELALKGSSDAPWDWDLMARRFEYSPQGWRMLGYGVDEAPSGPGVWHAVLHPLDVIRINDTRHQLQDAGESVVSVALRLRHKAGHYVSVLARGFVSRDEAGRAVRVTGTSMDLTAQQQEREVEALRPFVLELIASSLEVEPILERLIQRLEQLLPSSHGAAWLIDRQTKQLVPGAAPGLVDLLEHARAALAAGQEMWVSTPDSASPATPMGPAAGDSALRSSFNAMAQEIGLCACWSVPVLSSSGELLGLLDWHQKRAGEPSAYELKLINMVSQFVGQAIERKASEAQERLAAQVFSQSHDAIIITDANKQMMLVNPAFSLITGYAATEALGQSPGILSSGRHDAAFYAAMSRQLLCEGVWQGEIWNRRKSGEIYPQWLNISRMSNSFGETTHYIGMFSDISQRKADEERIKWMAHFDALTGLPNRILMSDRFSQAIGMAQRRGEALTLMFLDLDHFKNVNDSLGHGMGDELLVAVAQRMRQQVREQDTVSRMGGDEFVLVLPGTDASGAAHIAQKLMDAIARPYVIDGHELSVTPSIGIALYPQDGSDLESLAKHADVAMYRAKTDGRNAYRFYAPDMQMQLARALLLEGALRRALERDQLSLNYQPQRCLRTGRVVGVEALLRWQHPELGQISPAEFIPVAEKSGLILSIGEWVLRTAVAQLSCWLADGIEPIIMAVNLSTVQFRDPNLPEVVSRILREAALPPECLELELTEGVASDDPLGAVAIMDRLHARGVRMSIDDFGTGYSSLSYLKRFQVYKLKIDQSFVRELSVNPEDQAIVRAIISMASSLGLQTIAEGVETLAQQEFLRAQGCDEVQGYFCSRPLTARDCAQFLRRAMRQLEPA